MERKFRVKVKESITADYKIRACVRKGSVLGPLLYLIFTSDLPTHDKTLKSTFADDTAILSSDKNHYLASQNINAHMKKIESWLAKWRIKVNEQKSTHVTFTLRKETCPTVLLNNVAIPKTNEVTYFGIKLDLGLTWRTHIKAKQTQIKLKASQLS